MNKFIDYFKKIFTLEKRLTNVVRFGIVKEIDLASNLVVVDLGEDLESPKLPYLINGSGNAKVYFVPKVSDQVLLLSPNGNIKGAVVIPNIYKGTTDIAEDEWRLEFSNGSISYKEGELNIKANSKVNIETKEANIKGTNVKVDAGKITLAGEDGGGVVCQNNLCSFTGAPHPEGSSKVFGSR